MANSCSAMHLVLEGYAKFLREKDLALPKHQPYLVHWVREFLVFARNIQGTVIIRARLAGNAGRGESEVTPPERSPRSRLAEGPSAPLRFPLTRWASSSTRKRSRVA
jgi:hypothetical protein